MCSCSDCCPTATHAGYRGYEDDEAQFRGELPEDDDWGSGPLVDGEKEESNRPNWRAKIGITQAGISNIVTNAARKPSAPTLMRLAEELQCNPNWILSGKGDPFGWQAVTADTQVELLNLFKSMPEDAKQTLLAVARSMKKK